MGCARILAGHIALEQASNDSMRELCSKAIFGNLGVNKNCQKWQFFEYQLPTGVAEALIIATFGNHGLIYIAIFGNIGCSVPYR